MKIISSIAILFIGLAVNGQNPVVWSFTTKKISDKIYEVHIIASIQNGWHLYSQLQPESAIAMPTEIKFNSNPLLGFTGQIKEIGVMQKYADKTLEIEAWQYSEKVEFVQTIKLKANVKTNITGSIIYQACTNEKCLPPKTISFEVLIK